MNLPHFLQPVVHTSPAAPRRPSWRGVLSGMALIGWSLVGVSEEVQGQFQSTATQSRTSGPSAFSSSLGGGNSFGATGQGMSSVGQVTGTEFFVQGSQASTSFIGASSQTAGTGFIGANAATGQNQVGAASRNTRTGQTGAGQFGSGQFGTGQFGTSQFGTNRQGQFGGGQFGGGQFGNQGRTNQFGQQNRQFGQNGGTGRGATLYRPRLVLGFTPPPADVQTAAQTLNTQVGRVAQLPIFKSDGNNVDLQTAGRTVVLSGTVTSEDQKRLFERLVMLEPGVAGVENQIQVVPASQ